MHRFLFLFLLLCSPLFWACDRQESNVVMPSSANHLSTPPVHGDTLISGMIGDATNLLPVLSSDSASSEVSELVYNGLVRYDKNLKLEGELASSWEVSPDNLTITFYLRPGVTWHDGAPFSADDVLFTYQLLVDPKVPTAYADRYKLVTKAEVLDPLTFRVTYAKPLASALISWGFSVHPKHLLFGQDLSKSPLASAPIGTGPYRFKEWKRGEKMVLEANPDYWDGAPYIDRVVYRVIPDESTMFLELQAGGIDQMGLTPLQYARQTDTPTFSRQFSKYRYPSFAYTYLGYNLKNPLFVDKRVRQALSYAINKQELIDGVLLGLGQAATGPYKPGTWPNNPQVKKYPFDPQQAQKLLAAAGWSDHNGDGIVEKDGRPLAFTIVTNQGNEARIKTAEIIQRRFHDVGVDVKIRVIEWASFLKEFINPGKFEATILGWSVPIDPDSYNVWHSSKTHPGELNFVNFKNAEVDELLEKGRETLDENQRKKYYDRFQEILAEEQPYTFLYVPDALPVVSARFKGIEPAPAGIMHNFIRWWVPKDEWKYQQ